MSGETEKSVSGWTIDTLKALLDEREEHYRELRAADQKALDLALQNNKERLDHLNENAKRTIEERSHFVPVEVFNPFKDAVNKKLDGSEGQALGSQITMGKIYAAIAGVGGVVAIVVLIANGKI